MSVEVQGLFYRTTIEFAVELTPYQSPTYYEAPRPGWYEIA
ncbi:MAG: hypothetical protein ACUVTG_12110 [Candidatus Oleimicrobiaceae bacterium]